MSDYHLKLIDRIRAGEYSRAKLDAYEKNARAALAKGNQEAALVLHAIEHAKPKDLYYVFMGFCPDANLDNRLDTEWRRDGVCYMQHWSGNERQVQEFNDIKVGDLIVLKKNQVLGKTMKLYGHGRVASIKYAKHPEREDRYLTVEWAAPKGALEVPAMGCSATINVRSTERVHLEMPAEFYDWLGEA